MNIKPINPTKLGSKIALLVATAALVAGCARITINQSSQNYYSEPTQAMTQTSTTAATNTQVPTNTPMPTYTPIPTNTPTEEPTPIPKTLEGIITMDNLGENVLINGSFTDGNYGWDLRPGMGKDGGELGIVDKTVYLSEPTSLKIPYSQNVLCNNSSDCVRSVWPSSWIELGEDITKNSGQFYLTFKGDVSFGLPSDDCSLYWVNPDFAGVLGPYEGNAEEYHFYEDRGGVRLGVSFYNADKEYMNKVLRIADWSLEAGEWHNLEVCADIPEGAKYAVPWIQVYKPEVPISAWADNLELIVDQK